MTAHKQSRRGVVSTLVIAAFSFFLPILVSAQLPTATFLGVVKDSSGAVVPGATVTIHSGETNETRSAVTDSSGAYRVPALPVGHSDIKVEHSGFKTVTQTGLNLEVGEEAVVDFALQVGTAEQSAAVGEILSTSSGTTAVQSSGNSRQIQFGLKIAF